MKRRNTGGSNSASSNPNARPTGDNEESFDGSMGNAHNTNSKHPSMSKRIRRMPSFFLPQRIQQWCKSILPRVSPDDSTQPGDEDRNDTWNYALLIILYTIQGIPMGLSASIPFLIQQKLTAMNAALDSSSAVVTAARASSYNANAMFALCSWPFSLKLLWAPIVDACYIPALGRRKSWLVPVQSCAGFLLVVGAEFVERELTSGGSSLHVNTLTAYFFVLYFLMATQDIAVDGWALTLLSVKNRGRGPVCNSIGQNIGYFISFVGFLALNDAEACETLWRPLLRLKSQPNKGLVSLGGFLKAMGYFVLTTTVMVALFKQEHSSSPMANLKKTDAVAPLMGHGNVDNDDDPAELDAAEIGVVETYHRLWAVCQLPAVQWLFVILLTYRLPTSLADNVKSLKAVEYGLSKSTTALLSPTVILPLGILVPIIATRIWHDAPLQQFLKAYEARVTLVPLLDLLLLYTLQKHSSSTSSIVHWGLILLSTAGQAIVSSAQMNAQMTFFAKRVDPAIGGSYMTLLNTAANLGGTWPAPVMMGMLGWLSSSNACASDPSLCASSVVWRDPYFFMQIVLSILGCAWIFIFRKRLQQLSELPEEAWRTTNTKASSTKSLLKSRDVEM